MIRRGLTMYECNYSREPVNFRLLGLRLLKKIWLVPVSLVAGIILVLGVYLFYKLAVTGRTYQVENIYYIDFAEDSGGTQYTWVNQYTWSTLADMDVFIDGIYDELGGSVSRDDLCKYSDCTVESDGRYLYLRITTPNPELSKKISAAYEKTLFAFCEAHKEFNSIVCEHSGEVKENSNLRIKEVGIIGAVAGLMVLLVIWLTLDVTDTSIYIPSTIEARYHIATLTAKCMPEFEENCKHMLMGKSKVALIMCDEGNESVELPGINTVSFENPCVKVGAMSAVRECDGVVVCVKAGAHNGKQLERLIEQLCRQDVDIDAVMLIHEDEKLIRKYYRG